MHIALTQAAII